VLRHRLLTGSALIIALVALLWGDAASDGRVLPTVAIVVMAPLLGRELAGMLRGCGVAAPTALTVAAAIAGVASIGWAATTDDPRRALAAPVIAAWSTLAVALATHARGRSAAGTMAATGGTMLAFTWIGLMLGAWLMVRREVGPWVLVGAVMTVKSSDIGAYFTGMSIGRRKLIPWLSPGKSWEGLVGGIATAAATGGLLAWWSASLPDPADHVSPALGAVTGGLLGLVGPFGDLAESLLKRDAGVKDSGSLLPGMGGAFDVFDSPLLAGPVVWVALSMRG
jgi:phosphatidate cytidylyltransferase